MKIIVDVGVEWLWRPSYVNSGMMSWLSAIVVYTALIQALNNINFFTLFSVQRKQHKRTSRVVGLVSQKFAPRLTSGQTRFDEYIP